MKQCLLYPVSIRGQAGFEWRWRSLDNQAHSTLSFALFYECLLDARQHGHSVDMQASVAAARTITNPSDL
jgi:hypothetical protein